MNFVGSRPVGKILVALVVFWAPYALSANLVNNGSFEEPDIASTNTYGLYDAGSTSILGWTVVGGTINIIPDTYISGWHGTDGRQWLDLTGITGYNKGVKSDLTSTIVGQAYNISFDLGNFGLVSTLGLTINNEADRLFVNTAIVPNELSWTHYSLNWIASTASTTFSFLGRANGALSNDQGIGLDNVFITPVPEPGALALLAVGLGVMVLKRRLHR